MIDVDESKLIADLKEIYAQNDYGIVQMIYRDGNFIQETCGEAVDLIKKQYRLIEALENENSDIRQTHVSHDALAMVMADKERLERELAAALQMRIDTHAELICAWGENSRLQMELAAAKEDLHHNDACSVCIGADQEVCKDCDRECQTCVLDCRCKDCRDESKWEWRGAKGREDA